MKRGELIDGQEYSVNVWYKKLGESELKIIKRMEGSYVADKQSFLVGDELIPINYANMDWSSKEELKEKWKNFDIEMKQWANNHTNNVGQHEQCKI